jgi:hypothetical protein
MRRKLAILCFALVSALGGFVLSAASPAVADSNWSICHYDESGTYIGATSKFTGAHFTPAQITELGCNTDY